MQTIEQTLLIVLNCSRYTPIILSILDGMKNYVPDNNANKNRCPSWVTSQQARNCWRTNVSDLEFCFGEWEYPKLKDKITACIRYNKANEHEKNIEKAARILVNRL